MKVIYCFFGLICIVANAFAMADRTPPVYGVPTLYGEYEVSSDDTRRASKMYGNVPSHPVAIRAGAIKNTPAAKHPIKAKKTKAVQKKKSVKKSKSVSAQKATKVAKQLPMPKQTEIIEEVAAPEKVVEKAPVTPTAPVASRVAIDIASSVATKVDVDSFCTQVKTQGKGNLPDGIIMMPGRPDLMSCTTNNKD